MPWFLSNGYAITPDTEANTKRRQIRCGYDLLGIQSEHGEGQRVFRTVVNTVHAGETLAQANLTHRVGSAFTTCETQVTVRTLVHVAVDAED